MNYIGMVGALALAALGTQVYAQGVKSREDVSRELAQAIGNGDVLAPGESGLTLRELHPERYPAEPVARGKTRAEVQTELAGAVRTGAISANGESGLSLRDQNPQRYPAPTEVAQKTREQVKAELAQAIRTGDMLANGESGGTLNEAHPQWYATSPRASKAIAQAEPGGSR